jgi:N-carbamoylputrescine amidase
MKKIKIAVVQPKTFLGDVNKNHLQAEIIVEKATKSGAELVILPELFSTGYIPNFKIWDYGINSSSLEWLKNTSKKFNIYLGAGIIEFIEKDFRNTFVVSNPYGEIEGRAEKDNAESYIFRRGFGTHIINSSLCKIGVCICADNHFTKIIKKIKNEDIDIFIMPHAWPSPYKTSKIIKEEDILNAEKEIENFPSTLNKILGVPVIFSNQLGNIDNMIGLLGKFLTPSYFKSQGHSKIIDYDGSVKAKMKDEEGFSIAEVTLSKSKKDFEIPNYNGWIHKGSRTRLFLIPLDNFFGKLGYKKTLKSFLKKINLI